MARELAVLVVKVTADTAEVKASFERLAKDAAPVSGAFDAIGARAVAVGNIISTAFTKALSLAASAIGFLWGEIKEGIKLSAEYNGAIIGLIGVTRAYGGSASQAMAAAQSLAKDGLLTVGDAAKSLKNLLQTGFGLKEATDIVNVFKDAAVYGRQANFAYNESIVTATEGIKNMLSRNVDNVGITKNLSVIMAEAGMKMQDLTDKIKGAAARTALYNGLMREAAAASGDAARSLGTYHGAMAAMDTSYKSLLAHVGDFITRNGTVGLLLQELGGLLRWVTEWLVKNQQGYLLVSDAIVLVVRAVADFINVLDYLQLAYFGVANTGSRVIESLGHMGHDFSKVAEKVASLNKYLDPLHAEQWKAAQQDAAESAEYFNGVIKRQQDAIAGNTKTSIDWGNKLQAVRAKANELADRLAATRGNVIDLGEAARPAGQKVDQFAGAVDKAAAKAKEAKDALKWLKDEIKFVEQRIEDATARQEEWLKLQDLAFGTDVVGRARDYWKALGTVENVSKMTEGTQKKVNEAMSEAIDVFRRLGPAAERIVGIPLADWMFDVYYATLPVPKVVEGVAEAFGELVDLSGKKKSFSMWDEYVKGLVDHLHPLRDAFKSLALELPNILYNVLSSSEPILVGLAAGIGKHFGDAFSKAVKEALAEGRALTGGEKMLGLIGTGLDAFVGGYDIGAARGKGVGALAGAATGALQGAMIGSIVPGIGTAIGAAVGGIAGFVGGLFGGAKNAKEERRALNESKQKLSQQYGGMEKLNKLAEKLGVNIQAAFDAKKPEQFERAVDKLNAAIEAHNQQLEHLKAAYEAVNKRTTIYAQQFEKALEIEDPDAKAAKLAEIAQRTQPEFERLGLMVRDTFAALVRESGSGLDALVQLEPAFKVLQRGVDEFGLTSTAVIDDLLANFRLVTDEGLRPFFEAIQANGQILTALFEARALSPEGFQAIAADIGQSIQSIVEKGGDMARTLALSAPVLQTLWEAQQRFGQVTDQTTQAILKQAEEQGLVGDHMKSVNQQILDVLVAIGEVLGAKLPEYFRKLKWPAEDAATTIESAFRDIEIPPIEIPYVYTAENAPPVELGRGGIVRRPTLALIGEGGPEAVVPLTGQESLGVGGTYITDMYLDGDRIARSTARRLPSVLRTMGVS